MSTTKKTAELTNFAVCGSINPTLARMFSAMPDGSLEPIIVKKSALLGTQSQFGVKEDKVSHGNIQTVEVAFLNPASDRLVVKFGLKVFRDNQTANIEMCNLLDVRSKLIEISNAYEACGGFKKLGKLYAERIAGGSFLWRNRYGFDRGVKVVIRKEGDAQIETINFGMRPAEADIARLGDAIAIGLSGKLVDIQVEAFSVLGLGQEVYPSQEMARENKNISKVLFKDENDHAMMHDQKIGNAIRTIDIWHPSFDEVGAIAVEPYGTNVRQQDAYRYEKASFYDHLDGVMKGKSPIAAISHETDPDSVPDLHYFMAVLVRGGVLGMKKGSDKSESVKETAEA